MIKCMRTHPSPNPTFNLTSAVDDKTIYNKPKQYNLANLYPSPLAAAGKRKCGMILFEKFRFYLLIKEIWFHSET